MQEMKQLPLVRIWDALIRMFVISLRLEKITVARARWNVICIDIT